MNNQDTHSQAFVKVNVMVDLGIKPLIEALSLFPQLQTIESCQGHHHEQAWVCFCYGTHPWKELSEFVLDDFGPRLTREVGDNADILIRISEGGQVRGELFVRQGAISRVTDAISRIHKELGSL